MRGNGEKEKGGETRNNTERIGVSAVAEVSTV